MDEFARNPCCFLKWLYNPTDSKRHLELNDKDSGSENWLPIIARSVALLSLQGSGLAEKNTADKARFLEGLGISRKDTAAMLGTSAASVTELLSQANRRKKRGGPKRA